LTPCLLGRNKFFAFDRGQLKADPTPFPSEQLANDTDQHKTHATREKGHRLETNKMVMPQQSGKACTNGHDHAQHGYGSSKIRD
jgi:hypothetical protein